jgi:4-amino-4-deoxy-L-arabinose transferase-like glycosyltransferase
LTVATVGSITVLALVLRLMFLGDEPFWGDEILSVRRAQWSWGEFLAFMQEGVPAMAFYYLLLRFWIVLGESEMMVRLLSVVFGAATVPLVYLIGKRLFEARVGLVAALLMAVNTFHIQYSQEARSYSLLVFLVTLSTLFLIEIVQRPSWKSWAGFIAATGLAVYSHWFALLALAAQASTVVFLPGYKIPWKGAIVTAAVLAIVLTPIWFSVSGELASFVFQAEEIDEAERLFTAGAVQGFSLERVHEFGLESTGGGGNLLLIVYLILATVGGAVAVNRWATEGRSVESWKYALLISGLVLPIVITSLYSYLVEPALVFRYLLICLPFLVLLAALGANQIYWVHRSARAPISVFPVVFVVLIVALMGLSIKGAAAYYAEPEKEDWRGLTKLVASQWQPGDGIVFYVPWTNLMFDFYLHRVDGDVPDIRPMVEYRSWNRLTSSTEPGTREAIVQMLPDEPRRVWLVEGRLSSPERQENSDRILEALVCKYAPVQVTRFEEFNKVDLFLFQREGAAPTAAGVGGQPCDETAIVRTLQLNVIEDFEHLRDVKVYSGNGGFLNTRSAPGLNKQGYQVQFSGRGWWNLTKNTPTDHTHLYEGISLAIRGSGSVRLQLVENPGLDGRGGEVWTLPIVLTDEWKTLTYVWSDFQRDATSPAGNGMVDAELIGKVRLKQPASGVGLVVTDQWTFLLPEERDANTVVTAR